MPLCVASFLLCAAPATSVANETVGGVRFVSARYETGGENPFGVAAADLNEDGRLDLAVTHVGSHTVTVLLARSGGGFESPGPGVKVGRVPRGITSADLDADGHQDLVIAGGEANTVELLMGDGKGGGHRRSFHARIAPFNVAVADLNGDGRLDIAVANESNVAVLQDRGEVSVLLGDGRGGFAAEPVLHAGSHPADIRAVDLNRDGRTDLAVVNWESRDVALFFGLEGGSFSSATRVAYGGANSYCLDVGDLDGDGDADIAVGDTLGLVRILSNDGAGGFRAADVLRGDRGLRSLVIADLNGDGRPDVATANPVADNVAVIFRRAGAGFSEPYHVAVGNHPRNVIAADLNGDARTDLVVTNIEDDDVSVLLNAGSAD